MGKNAIRMLKFAIKHAYNLANPHWHGYGKDRKTVDALRRLESLGFIEVDRGCRVFRLNTSPIETTT